MRWKGEIDKGISETITALKAPAIQEKIIPYLEGLNLIEKEADAEAVRHFMATSSDDEDFLDRLDKALTPRVVFHINEAFRGKVLVVERNMDRLYQSLVHRKYTLSQTRKIIGEWLGREALSEDTFLHFVGRDETNHGDQTRKRFREYLEGSFAALASSYRRMGYDRMIRAMGAALWAHQYPIPSQEISPLFSLNEKDPGGPDRMPDLLAQFGETLREQEPELFASVMTHLEEDGDFIQTLWSSLPDISPTEIFKRESILFPVLKEAFERIMGGKPTKKDLHDLLREDNGAVRGHALFEERKERDGSGSGDMPSVSGKRVWPGYAGRSPLGEVFPVGVAFHKKALSSAGAHGKAETNIEKNRHPFSPVSETAGKRRRNKAWRDCGRLQDILQQVLPFVGKGGRRRAGHDRKYPQPDFKEAADARLRPISIPAHGWYALGSVGNHQNGILRKDAAALSNSARRAFMGAFSHEYRTSALPV